MTDPRCGSTNGYQAHYANGTKPCTPCREAKAAYRQKYAIRRYQARQPLTVDATGTRRRLHALMVLGWPTSAIGAELGVSEDAVKLWTWNGRVRLETAAKVAALYDRWWDRPGPSRRTAAYAARKGWLVPMAWDEDNIDDPEAKPVAPIAKGTALDEIAMERAMYDAAVPLRPAERAEVVRRLTRAGLSAAQIAQRLDTTPRSVTRWRGKGGVVMARTRIVMTALACDNGGTNKDGPGGCANTRTPGPNPRVSEGYDMSTPLSARGHQGPAR